jgi:hypothetical protein
MKRLGAFELQEEELRTLRKKLWKTGTGFNP